MVKQNPKIETQLELTPEQQEMKESLDESLKGKPNVGESTLSTVPKNQAVAYPMRNVGIAGMEDIPASMIALPYVRLIQPSSKNTLLEDGSEAPSGSFLFNDTQTYVEELNFVLLRAKHEMIKVDKNGQFVLPDYEGETKEKPRVTILGITTNTDKLFILSLSATSFSSFGKLIAKLKEIHAPQSWLFELNLKSEKKENEKGKYHIVNFTLKKELDKSLASHMADVAAEYGLVLDRQFIPEEE